MGVRQCSSVTWLCVSVLILHGCASVFFCYMAVCQCPTVTWMCISDSLLHGCVSGTHCYMALYQWHTVTLLCVRGLLLHGCVSVSHCYNGCVSVTHCYMAVWQCPSVTWFSVRFFPAAWLLGLHAWLSLGVLLFGCVLHDLMGYPTVMWLPLHMLHVVIVLLPQQLWFWVAVTWAPSGVTLPSSHL